MRYALLLWADTAAARQTTAAEAEAEFARYAEISRELAASGMLEGGEAFLPADTATVVDNRDGVATGPAPGSDPELSGFYLVDCSEQEAIDIAAGMPVATHGRVEVRPLMDPPE